MSRGNAYIFSTEHQAQPNLKQALAGLMMEKQRSPRLINAESRKKNIFMEEWCSSHPSVATEIVNFNI